MSSDLFLPVPDSCGRCDKPQAVHTGWLNGGPSHDFVKLDPVPHPDRIVSAHIQTEWTCSHCGTDLDVWGVAEDWMNCTECGRDSYLVPFLNNDPQSQDSMSGDSQ